MHAALLHEDVVFAAAAFLRARLVRVEYLALADVREALELVLARASEPISP